MEIKTDPVDIKYEIGDDIGRGKFATVKRCRDRKSGCEYAAKFIRKSRGTSRRGAKMENIEKEIQILSETNHRNIINLYEVYDTKREVILILELVDGGELFEYLSEKDKLCEEEASSFVKQILEGVEHLHAQDIAHLDLKPENILLQDKNSTAVKLIDFGLSRKILPREDHRAIMGTAEFCAPEVISFEPLSVQTDMWSIGVITYVLLSGLSPFLGDNQQETYHNITSINFEFDEEYFNGTSDLAKDFIQKLLVKDTRKRANIHDCLNHPWIKPVEKRDQVLRRSSVINTEHLKKFIARQRWKRSMKVVSLCNRLSRSMQLRRIMSSDTIGSTSEDDADEMTDTEKQDSDRESSELTGSYRENVISCKELSVIDNDDKNAADTANTEREFEKIVDANKGDADTGHINKEVVDINKEVGERNDTHVRNVDISNLDEVLAEIKDTDETNTHVGNIKTESAENLEMNKGNADIVNISRDTPETEFKSKENTNIGSINIELASDMNAQENADIVNVIRELTDIRDTKNEITEIPIHDKELANSEEANEENSKIDKTNKENDNIPQNSKALDGTVIADIENVDVGEIDKKLIEIDNVNGACKKSGTFDQDAAKKLCKSDDKDQGKDASRNEDLKEAGIPNIETMFTQITDSSQQVASPFLLNQTSYPEIKENSDSEAVYLPVQTWEIKDPDAQAFEQYENSCMEPILMPESINTDELTDTSTHEIGAFDDDIGLLVSGTFESEFDPLGLTEFVQFQSASGTRNTNLKAPVMKETMIAYSETVPDKSNNLFYRNVQQKRLGFQKVGETDVNATAKQIVAQVIEASVFNVLRETDNRINSNIRSVLQQIVRKEFQGNNSMGGNEGEKPTKHYDPLRLVCFENDDVMYEVSSDEENDEEFEYENPDMHILKVQRKNSNANKAIKGEKNKVNLKGKLFKPHTTSKFDFHARKHLEQRSFRRSRKIRPELRVKKKANRFWEMEDCMETGRYEMFEMQVLNNSE